MGDDLSQTSYEITRGTIERSPSWTQLWTQTPRFALEPAGIEADDRTS
jgi:hypothetical protein